MPKVPQLLASTADPFIGVGSMKVASMDTGAGGMSTVITTSVYVPVYDNI